MPMPVPKELLAKYALVRMSVLAVTCQWYKSPGVMNHDFAASYYETTFKSHKVNHANQHHSLFIRETFS